MQTKKRLGLVAVLLVSVAVARGSQPGENTELSNTRQMRCVMKVTADPDVMPIGFDLLESLLRSDAVAGRAAKQTWPTSHGVHDAFFDVRPLEESGPQGEAANDAASPQTRVLLFELQIHINNDVPPAAKEFGGALIGNLRAELQEAFAAHSAGLKAQLAEADAQRQVICKELGDLLAQNRFAEMEQIRLDPADEAVHKQFERAVALPAIRQSTPLTEAMETLARSVEPPLRIVVLWRDLLDNADVEPMTPVQMDGLADIRLGTALERLLNAISNPLYPENPVEYSVDHGVITVATREGLPRKKIETRVYELPPLLRAANQTPEIAALIRETIEPGSWYDLYPTAGKGTIATSTEGKLIVSQSRDIHIRIQKLLAKLTAEVSVSLPPATSQETLAERMEPLLSYRSQLEEELDRLQLRLAQISREKEQKKRQSATETLRMTTNDLYTAATELRDIQTRMAGSRPDAAENQRLQQTILKIEQCGNRCSQIQLDSGSVLDKELPWLDGSEEKTVILRIAAKQRDLREVGRRIADIQRAMVGSTALDTEWGLIQDAAGRYEQASVRIEMLTDRIDNLQPCTVTVLGGIE